MKSSGRNWLITIQRDTGTTRDAMNNPVENWTTLAEAWAEKVDMTDRERMTAKEVAAEATTRFRILYSSDVASVTPKDRILLDDGRIYDITGVRETGFREGLEITAARRADK